MKFKVNVEKIENFQAKKMLQLFAFVEQNEWSFLLDSCEQTSMQGRYDIAVTSPCITYEYARGKHTVSGDWTNTSKSSNPNKGLKQFENYRLQFNCPYKNLAKLQREFASLFDLPALSNIKAPYIAGAVGAFGYDINTSNDKIIDANPTQYTLPDISVGFYCSSLIYDNLLNTLYIFSIDQGFIDDTLTKINKLSFEDTAFASFSLEESWTSNLSQQLYYEKFTKIENYLRAGDCYQVNFAQRFSAQYEGSEWTAYLQLRKANKAPFSVFARLPNNTILSLSPERFLQVKEGKVETKPIKGTRKRNADPTIDLKLANELLNADKDQAENLMIVDLMRNDLSKHCLPHSVKTPELFKLESYPAVHHLVSTVVGTLNSSTNVYALLKGAFPGGSITGAPKIRAMQIIQELEIDKRSIYCGSIGYVGIRGDMDTNICIRTLLAESTAKTSKGNKQNTLYCWAGGGIVIDSKNEDEYLESLHKVANILPVLENQIKGTG